MRRRNVPDRVHAIARFVRERRKGNRLTQAELGELAGVGRRLIVEIEQGKPTLRFDTANSVLAVFGKTLGVVDAPRSEVEE